MSANKKRLQILDHGYSALAKIFSEMGQPDYRVEQFWQGLYRQLWDQPEQFTILSKSLRQSLSDRYNFSSLKPGQTIKSTDNATEKILFQSLDGISIETVLMRYSHRRTLCVSTQAGCALGCVFCATGQMGLSRNLTSGEIIEQVLYFARRLKEADDKLTNIVFMGMGEPFLNYDATMAAIERLRDPSGFNFGSRRFTISTVGIVPAIQRFAGEYPQVNLAVSLHAVNDEMRSSLVPINRKYPVDQLLTTCLEYVQSTNRRITFEWALIKNINDDPSTAQDLAEKLKIFRKDDASLCHVNLIPLNPTHSYKLKAASKERVIAFSNILKKYGIPCTIRIRRGIDIQAGCGQLATQKIQ